MNLFLTSGIVPLSLKHAIVGPHLKKPHADSEDFTNYRPVSNLSFLSKILEKLVAKRLPSHMDNHNLHEVMQLAYKKYHSTETTLVRVQNDILTYIDNKHGVILVLLDLSAAFDTIDHKTVLHQLRHRMGISGTALEWFRSYLTGWHRLFVSKVNIQQLYPYNLKYHRDRCLDHSCTPFTRSHLVIYSGNKVCPTICMQMTPSCTLHLISLKQHPNMNH